MKLFVLSTQPDSKGKISLSGKDYHYLINVRRLKAGDSFSAVLAGGESAVLKIDKVEGKTVECVSRKVSAELAGAAESSASAEAPAASPFPEKSPQKPEPRIILFQAVAKGAKMDSIARQAAETGLSEIIPFYSSRSVPRGEGGGEKTARWERIVREARQQSGSRTATAIRAAVSMDDALGYWRALSRGSPASLGILLHEIPLAEAALHDYLRTRPELVALAVGPEGGFSPAEAARFIDSGFKPLFLGNNVFRVDTAALYGTAAIQTILRESESWI